MKKTLKVIAACVFIALLNSGLSFVGDINMVWIFAASFFVADMESTGVLIAVLAGFVSDMLLHGGLGMTGLVILVSLVLYVVVRSIGICHRTWQKVLAFFIVMFAAYLIEYLMKMLLGDGPVLSLNGIYYCAGRTLPSVVLSSVIYGVIVFWREQHPERATVKL